MGSRRDVERCWWQHLDCQCTLASELGNQMNQWPTLNCRVDHLGEDQVRKMENNPGQSKSMPRAVQPNEEIVMDP